MTGTFLAAIALSLIPHSNASGARSGSPDSIGRAIRYRVDVPAPVDRVWRAWTTVEGIREWFARDAMVELEALGTFEILFMPENPPGKRGAEHNLFLVRLLHPGMDGGARPAPVSLHQRSARLVPAAD